MQVKAVDGDGSSPNNNVYYRINSGAVDKFVIDALTGQISVSPGAKLDPDLMLQGNDLNTQNSKKQSLSYIIEILALDGGLGEEQRVSVATVNISIQDVNNKPPYFERQYYSDPFHLTENSDIGYVVTTVQAKDPDTTARLEYSIDVNLSVAKNELGI